jgi:type VI secretion system secreted protein Hcp
MALDMFLLVTGPQVKGETADKDSATKDAIDVLAWSWGASQSGTTHMGGGGGAGKASFQDFSFTKYVDTATGALLTGLAKGTHFQKIELLVRKSGEGQKPYMKITMSEAMVTSLSTGGSGGEDRLTENVTLNFAKVKVEYFKQDNKGVLATAGAFGWNIAGNVEEK